MTHGAGRPDPREWQLKNKPESVVVQILNKTSAVQQSHWCGQQCFSSSMELPASHNIALQHWQTRHWCRVTIRMLFSLTHSTQLTNYLKTHTHTHVHMQFMVHQGVVHTDNLLSSKHRGACTPLSTDHHKYKLSCEPDCSGPNMHRYHHHTELSTACTRLFNSEPLLAGQPF